MLLTFYNSGLRKQEESKKYSYLSIRRYPSDFSLTRIQNTQQANDTCGVYKAGVLERLLPSALLPAAIKFMSIICYLDQKVSALVAFMSFARVPWSEEL